MADHVTSATAAAQIAHADAAPESIAAAPKDKKRKVVIYIAYVGAGYSGMQINPGAYTIEKVLEEAIYKAGGISDDNAHDFAKINWQRAARTDKGVSAVGQVVSLKMMIGQPDIVERINAHLPAQIRVLGYTRVTNSFDARHLCDRRRYEYVLPAFAFDTATSIDESASGKANGSDVDASTAPLNTQAPATSKEQRRGAAGASGAPEAIQHKTDCHTAATASPAGVQAAENGTAGRTGEVADVLALGAEVLAQPQARASVTDAHAMVTAAASDLQHDQSGTRPTPPGHPGNPVTAAALDMPPDARPGTFNDPRAALASSAAVGGKDGQLAGVAGLPEDPGAADDAPHGASHAAEAVGEVASGAGNRIEDGGSSPQSGFVFDEAKRLALNAVLRQYVGTNNFHNFTSRMTGGDPAASRYILSFECSGTFQLAGQTWVRMVVVGQSFILHQIRKMVGLAVAVMRGVAPRNAIPLALDPLRDVNTPTAPELGLFLDECIFAAYNTRWGEDREELVSLEPYKAQVAAFKEEFLYPQIAERDALESVNSNWLRTLSERNYGFSTWHLHRPLQRPPSGLSAKAAVQPQESYGSRERRHMPGEKRKPPNDTRGNLEKRPHIPNQEKGLSQRRGSASVVQSMDAEWSD